MIGLDKTAYQRETVNLTENIRCLLNLQLTMKKNKTFGDLHEDRIG